MGFAKSKSYISLFLLIVLFISYGVQYGTAQENPKKTVLVLNSYHKGYKWSDNVMEGITGVLGASTENIDLQVEDMDTQRISDRGYIAQLFETYKYKFSEKKFDVIIASDDPAFTFLRQYHKELFPDTPIVFCGVNYFEDSMLMDKELFTGVVEGQDIKSTLDIALKLHPETKNIYVVNDKTLTGNAIEKTLQDTIPEFKDKVNFISLHDYNMVEIKEKVGKLSNDSLLLFLVFFQDQSGEKFSYAESITQVAKSSTVPIYGVWDFSLGYGLVGGMLTSGYYQGNLAGILAKRILKGEKPSEIPIVKNSPNHYMFDSSQLKRFNIKKSDLPAESIIVNDTYSGKKQVLVLNSYYPGMTWTDNIIAGVKSILNEDHQIDLHYEFMDTKHNTGPEYLQKIHEIYKYKFSNKHFDAILASDDDAYNFLLKYQGEIFPDTPVVFCGVNYFEDRDIKDKRLFTGVVELVDVKKTIEIALKLQPNVKKITIINDKTVTGQANKKILEDVIPHFPLIEFTFFEDMNMSEIQDRVSLFSDDRIILLMSFNKDKSNNIYSYEESAQIIAGKSSVPVYAVWDFYLGQGIMGGMLTSGYYQGETAAKIILRILRGEIPQEILVIKESPNKYMFDYQVLERYHIDQDSLPIGSIIINKPISKMGQYVSFSLGLFFLTICMFFMVQRKKAQDKLKIFATTDSLTGTLNRGTGLAMLQKQIDYHQRHGKKLTIIFIDINHLKKVNDSYGHEEGDNLIQRISGLLQEKIRKSDVICRLGGDEFLLIFPNCELKQAMEIWGKIKEHIDTYNARQQHEYLLSVSHGYGEYDPQNPVSIKELIKVADVEMYGDKRLYKLNLENEKNLT